MSAPTTEHRAAAPSSPESAAVPIRALAPWAVAIVAAAFIAWWPATRIGFVTDDDVSLVERNRFVQSPSLGSAFRLFTYIERDLYQPIPMLTLMIDTALGGSRAAFVHHLNNITVHAGACVLLLLVGWQILRQVTLAGLAALFYAVHPLHSEVMAAVANRIPLLSTLFALAATWLFLRNVSARPARLPGDARPGLFAVSPGGWWVIGLITLCQLSKVTPFLIPAMIALALVQPDPRPLRERLIVALRLAIWPAIIVLGFIALAWYTTVRAKLVPVDENLRFGFNLQLTFVAMWHHLRSTVFPWWITPIYYRPYSIPTSQLIVAVLGVLGVVGFVAWLGRRRPVLWAGFAWWLLAVGPTLPAITIRNQLTADRYAHLALPGLMLALAALLIGRTWPKRRVIVAGCLLVVGGAGFNWAILPYYNSTSDMVRLAAQVYGEDDARVLMNRAGVLSDAGHFEAAKEVLADLQARFPNQFGIWVFSAELAFGRQDWDEVLRCAERAAALTNVQYKPTELKARVARETGRWADAARLYAEAITWNEHDPRLYLNLGQALRELRRLDEAAVAYRHVIDHWPGFSDEAYYQLGHLALLAGRAQEAYALLTRATSMNANRPNVIGDLAAAAFLLGDMDQASRLARIALDMDPNLPGAKRLLETIGRNQGQEGQMSQGTP